MPELGGTTVILTRAPADNAPLAMVLRESGTTVIELPCIAVAPVADPRQLGQSLRALTAADRLVVTSRAGARAVAQALAGDPLRSTLAVVGPATERAAHDLGLVADFRPSRADTASLARELPLPAGVVALARSDRATGELVALLRARGARIQELVAYRTSVATDAATSEPAREACARGAVVVLASPSAVEGFARFVGIALARRCRLLAIGPSTATRIREVVGREPEIAARPASDAILAVIREALLAEVPA